ncbi:MAG TPA: hypothetical protein PK530_04130 [Anaerolineales bacterium]|nr:hypothetical protein [Anaerolineales bacterium]
MLENAATAGMTEAEFWDSTPRYFAARLRAWSDARKRELQDLRTTHFFIVRAAGAKITSPENLYRYEWEAARVVEFEPMDEVEMQRFSDEADEALRILNPEAWERYIRDKAATPPPAPPPKGGVTPAPGILEN